MNLYIPLVKHHLSKTMSLVSLYGISKLQIFNSVGNSAYFVALTEKETSLHILVRFFKKINGIDLSFPSISQEHIHGFYVNYRESSLILLLYVK